ncbi:MAG: radical SAM protein [Myxococcales bacterium]|nr:radical SAM protein [Myxococcales bacterium]
MHRGARIVHSGPVEIERRAAQGGARDCPESRACHAPGVDYVGRIFRPPSEARSLLLQVSVGCSHNRCTYCDMYTEKSFRTKPFSRIEADLEEARRALPRFDRIFLCDGDALILSERRLLQILGAIREKLPWVERIGVYGDTRSVGGKSVESLRRLREAGLGIVYHGMESADPAVLTRIRKGGTAEECIETADKLREAGIVHSVMVLLGVGGRDRSEAHAHATAAALTRMQPRYVGALTLTVVPGTPIAAEQERGEFALPDRFGLLGELRTIVAESELRATRLSANHASNYLPIRADLPQMKGEVLSLLDRVIASRDESLLKPESLRGL